MKSYFCSSLLALAILCGSAMANDKSGLLRTKIVTVSPAGRITIEISNLSKDAIEVWNGKDSAKWAPWRVLLFRKGQLRVFHQDPVKDLTKNTVTRLAVGGHVTQELDLNEGSWGGLNGEKINFDHGDMIVVVYDVPIMGFDLWYGVVSAFMNVP